MLLLLLLLLLLRFGLLLLRLVMLSPSFASSETAPDALAAIKVKPHLEAMSVSVDVTR